MVRIGWYVVVAAAVFVGTPTPKAAEQVGIPSCDTFLAQYEACIDTKIPEAQRAFHRKTVEEKRKGWIEYGNKFPSLKSSLGETCKSTMTLIAVMLEPYGCSVQ
jgi:hypothetical protein